MLIRTELLRIRGRWSGRLRGELAGLPADERPRALFVLRLQYDIGYARLGVFVFVELFEAWRIPCATALTLGRYLYRVLERRHG
jgi:hypothetical protein